MHGEMHLAVTICTVSTNVSRGTSFDQNVVAKRNKFFVQTDLQNMYTNKTNLHYCRKLCLAIKGRS